MRTLTTSDIRSPYVARVFGLMLAAALAAPSIHGGLNAAEAMPRELIVMPAKVDLVQQRAEQRIVVTGVISDGVLRDLTHEVTFTSANPSVAIVDGIIVRPVADGDTQITMTYGELSSTVDVHVSGMSEPDPVSFQNETLAALTKAGCNMGACHGAPSGKGGFRLSLRAYDAELDITTLRSEFFARRTNTFDPDASLLLRKPLMELAHAGGRRLWKDGAPHAVLRQWVAEGLPLDRDDEPTLTSIEVFPAIRVLHPGMNEQQILVTGRFSDGTARDLTSLADFSSSQEAVASVDRDGLIERTGRGESAILVRYLDKVATSYLTFLEDVPGLVWNDPPTNNFVDTHVFSKLERLRILPSELCTDDEFVRRATLDVCGRLPTMEEAKAFLDDPSANKRALLIDRLLETDDYASYWSLKWCDVLRANSKKLKLPGVHKFHQWVFQAMRDDVPFNETAYDLLTASGSTFRNPPAAYWRASRNPEDAVETTSQLFLGIRIQCAKCHNHPFERWTQDNYYGIAAAFARLDRKAGTLPEDEVVFLKSAGEVTQPRTGRTMPVHLPLQGDVQVPNDQDRRQVFADWLTKPGNPFFAKVAVNRVWGHLFGKGIVEPVDDFRDSNPPSHGELLNDLAEQFAANNFSHKWAIRAIMNSRVYQLSARTNEFNADDDRYFSHAEGRLLAAEQLLDAVCTVTEVPEKFNGYPVGMRATELADPPTDHEFLKIFGQPQREMACACERSSESNLSQALQMINGPLIHEKLRSDSGRIQRLLKGEASDEQIVQELYLTALARRPNEQELQTNLSHIANSDDRRLALEDVAWAILNSKEFLFQH